MKSRKSFGSQRHKTEAMRGNIRPFRHVFSTNYGGLENLEQLNPLKDIDSRNQFLSNFDGTDSTLECEGKQAVEALVVDFQTIFARHRFDIGINTYFKVQLTPLDNRPAHS